MHRNPVVELEHDQPVVRHFAASDLNIHNVVERRVWPPAFFPMGNELAVAKEIHRGLDGKTDGAERELEIELTYSYLRRELPHDGREVKLLGYPVHSRHAERMADQLRATRLRVGCSRLLAMVYKIHRPIRLC